MLYEVVVGIFFFVLDEVDFILVSFMFEMIFIWLIVNLECVYV